LRFRKQLPTIKIDAIKQESVMAKKEKKKCCGKAKKDDGKRCSKCPKA
jgi:hypothetical protein